MTKLLEWLLVTSGTFSIWFAVIASSPSVIKEWRKIILFLPIILLFLFGLYAVIVIMYRVFTFNNCESAAAELQLQIQEAKKDLRSKGITLKETDISLMSKNSDE